jgi:signal transduction histidine kinase
LPKSAAVLLAVAGALPAVVVGWAGDSSAIILSVIALGRLATLTSVSVGAIVGLGLLDIALAVTSHGLAGHSLGEALADPGVMLLLVLIGLNRRQYEVQATQAEALLEQTRLAQAEHARAAALDERTRIARELHDVLAHSLGALGVQLELAAAVVALVGIAREALTNAGKHAPGEDVRMRLSYEPGVVRLDVRNALGEFTRTGEGFGLAGMRERLALAEGSLMAGPEDGHWRVLAEVRG